MAEIITKQRIVRFEKQELLLQMKAMAKIVDFADKYYEFKDCIDDMAEEAGRNPAWLWEWCLTMLNKDEEPDNIEAEEE